MAKLFYMRKSILSLLLVVSAMVTAQVESIREDFTNFANGPFTIPQNGWKSDKEYPYVSIYKTASGNNYLAAYSSMETNPVNVIAPELISVKGTLVFAVAGNKGGTLEVGLVDSPTNMASFEKLYEREVPVSKAVKYEMEIPDNTKKFITFKFVPLEIHSTMGLDNISFTPVPLSTNETIRETEKSDVVFNSNTQKLVLLNDNVKNISIVNMLGQKVSEIKSPNKEENLNLNTGIYIVLYENQKGEKKSVKIQVR